MFIQNSKKKSTGTQNESTDIVEKKEKLANIISKVLTSVNQMSFVNINIPFHRQLCCHVG